jgi:hypothetical protein
MTEAEKEEWLRQRQLELYNAGKISEQDYQDSVSRINETYMETASTLDDWMQGFGEGLQDGADNIRNAVTKTAAGAAGLTARMIPWWVWLIGIAWVAEKFGLFDGLKAKWRK